jgi:hypothetical protein
LDFDGDGAIAQQGLVHLSNAGAVDYSKCANIFLRCRVLNTVS